MRDVWRRLGGKLWWGMVFLLVACGGRGERPSSSSVTPLILTPPPTPPVTPLPSTGTPPLTPSPDASPVSLPAPTETPVPDFTLGAETAVPPELVQAAREMAAAHPESFAWRGAPETADLVLRVGAGEPLATWVYAVAAPFPTVRDAVPLAMVEEAWQTGATEAGRWVVDEATAAAWRERWGETTVSPLPSDQLVDALWEARPALTLLPFHRLTPRLKVLAMDGRSPLDADFAPEVWPLTLAVGLDGPPASAAQFRALWQGPTTNRDLARLTTVAMSGVTALVRATAYQMELNGVSYPGTAVAPVLNAADVAHVSNEVAFAPDCPYPNPVGGTTFCSRERYFPLLEAIGADVVEVTGNHVNDWGRDAFAHTLDLYEAAGMDVFGGGRDLAAATRPLTITHHGNQIAFVGCNPVGPAYAWATADAPGSRPCDQGFYDQIGTLRDQGYLVIAALQYQELYHYAPAAQQAADFQRVIDAGAAAVSGSQGHHAQGFALPPGGFIHYGLGNLFFDQMDRLGTRQTFIDTYYIYEGRLLGVHLWTGLIENYARPRPMTATEREGVLTAVFQASGW